MKTCLWMTALMLLAVSGAPLDAAKLQASDGSAYDAFGRSASLSGSAGLVGAYRDDDNGNDSGSAYLFRNLDTATEDARLTASDGAASDFFGCSSSLSGSAGLVGAYGDGAYSGSAYLFRNLDTAAGTVTENSKLTASDSAAYDAFGCSASLSGSAGLVGAYGDGAYSGSAYLFRNLDTAAGTVTENAKLTASDGAASDFFGHSVSLSGSAGLVGAYGDDDNGDSAGSAYLFRNLDTASGTVTEDVKLTASDGAAYDAFGRSASLSGSAGLVGAYGDGGYSGSAYLFRNLDTAAGTVTENVKLTASDGAASDYFGHSVSLSGSAGLIGAYQDDDNGDESGSAYLFRNLDTAAGTVTEDVKLTASDGAAYDAFGCSANLDGDRFLIGAQNGDGAVASSGKAYSGSVKSITTLNDGGASKTISGISFESRTDWIIGETTDDNAVTLSAGDAGDVTAVGKAVYIGKADTSDLNDLFLHGALTATAVYIGTMDGDGNEGNALWLAATADTSGVNNFYLSFGNMLKVESDVSDTGDLLTYLGSSNLKIWNGSTWETLAIGNASGLITTGFDGSYTSVRAIPEPATALLFGLGGISAWILRRERHLMQEV